MPQISIIEYHRATQSHSWAYCPQQTTGVQLHVQGRQLSSDGRAQQEEEGAGGAAAEEGTPPTGCCALVALEFCQRPEWLRPGARLLLRDRCDNRLSGAGVVRALLPGGVPRHRPLGRLQPDCA